MSKHLPSQFNVWQVKPWWCQPWSILLTGVGLVAASWFLTRLIWVALLVAVPVTGWMGYFLLIYPKLMAAGWMETQDEVDLESDLEGDRPQ